MLGIGFTDGITLSDTCLSYNRIRGTQRACPTVYVLENGTVGLGLLPVCARDTGLTLSHGQVPLVFLYASVFAHSVLTPLALCLVVVPLFAQRAG